MRFRIGAFFVAVIVVWAAAFVVRLAAQQVQVAGASGSELATIKAPSVPASPTDTALVVTTRDPFPAGSTALWACGLNALAASLTQCRAAPGANLKLYVTGIFVQTTTATSGTYAVQTGTGTNCATGTAQFFPVTNGTLTHRFNAPINSQPMASLQFQSVPLIAPVNSAVCVIGVATNTISIQIVGFTAP